jgi:hypothetical protein
VMKVSIKQICSLPLTSALSIILMKPGILDKEAVLQHQ